MDKNSKIRFIKALISSETIRKSLKNTHVKIHRFEGVHGPFKSEKETIEHANDSVDLSPDNTIISEINLQLS